MSDTENQQNEEPIISRIPKPVALVVEDDQTSRDALGSILGRLGFEAVYASTVTDAIALLKSRQPECVILDLMLSDGNGAEVLKQIRTSELPTRVAIVTGVSLPILSEVLKLRPDAVFRKPYSAIELRDWLRIAA